MKIIHIIPGKANPATQNGVNKVVHSLADEQFKSGNEVLVYGIANNTIRRHFPKYRLCLIKKNPIFIFPPFKLLWLLTQHKRDAIIHLHSGFISWFPFLSVYLRLLGFKYILTPNGVYNLNKFKNRGVLLLYYYLFESIVLVLSRKVHIVGLSELNEKTKFFIENKYVVIYNGCYGVKDEKKENNHNLTFGYLGRLKIDHKGLDLLIDGFKLYVEGGGKGELLLAGDGPDKEKLVNQTSNNTLSSRVQFLGEKFGEDKNLFIRNLSFFVHTSRWEGFPTACLEAAEYCIPLIISKETNLGDLVKNYKSGFVLKQNTSQEIMNALFYMESIFYSNNYKILSLNTANMVKAELTWKNISAMIIKKIYL